MPTWDELYRANVVAITQLAGDLTDDQLATRVPGSPDWTVHEVLAHLAGGPADAVSDRMDGAPGPEWTARHVAERAGRPVAELTAEMRANQDDGRRLHHRQPAARDRLGHHRPPRRPPRGARPRPAARRSSGSRCWRTSRR